MSDTGSPTTDNLEAASSDQQTDGNSGGDFQVEDARLLLSADTSENNKPDGDTPPPDGPEKSGDGQSAQQTPVVQAVADATAEVLQQQQDLHNGEGQQPQTTQAQYKNLLGAFTRSRQELSKLRKERESWEAVLKDRTPDDLRQVLEEHSRLQSNNVAPWNRRSPHYNSFMNLVGKGQEIASRVQRIQLNDQLSPEQRAALIQEEERSLTTEQWRALGEYRQENQRFLMDPFGSMEERLERAFSQEIPQIIEQRVAEMISRRDAEKSVETWFESNKDKVEKYRPLMKEVLDLSQKDPWSVTRAMTDLVASLESLEAENKSLKEKLVPSVTAAISADAQGKAVKMRVASSQKKPAEVVSLPNLEDGDEDEFARRLFIPSLRK